MEPMVLYGPAIHQTIASGDVDKMKDLVKKAEKHLEEHGDISSALEILKAEIAKHEK